MVLVVLGCTAGACFSQDQDSIVYDVSIDSIMIVTSSGVGQRLDTKNRSLIGSSAIRRIDQLSSMTIRSGGPGLITTALRRGMASRHLAVLWNGFNIQSAVNGTYDLSLLPRTFSDAKLLSHEKSTIIGNASSAGALSIQNNLQNRQRNVVAISYGSDSNMDLLAQYQVSTEVQSHRFGIDLGRHKNRYDYDFGRQRITQEFARFDLMNITYDGQLRFRDKLSLKMGTWLQKAERQIPPSKTSANPMQSQTDENYRGFAALQYQVTSRIFTVARAAMSREVIHFVGPGIDSRADVDVVDMALDIRSDNGLTASLQHRSDRVDASFFANRPTRSATALVLSYKKRIKSLETEASVRPHLVDGSWQPFTYHVRADYAFSDQLSIIGHHGRGYTLPALNDLYWPQGGDPDLLAETSYLNDISIHLAQNKSKVSLELFHNSIDNWIQWVPVAGVFRPVNQRKVRNVGIDLSAEHGVTLSNDLQLSAVMRYSFLDGRLVRHYSDPTLEGKKTIFVPANKAVLSVDLSGNTWSARINSRYYGDRFDTVDNSSSVDRYAVIDVTVNKRFSVRKMQPTVTLSIENILNTDYEHIRFFPMPLRLLRVGVSFAFN